MARLAGKRTCGNWRCVSWTARIYGKVTGSRYVKWQGDKFDMHVTGMPGPREIVLELLIMLAVALVLAALGPFDSFAMGGFGTRLAYWLPAAFIGYAVIRPTLLVAIAVGNRIELPDNVAILASVILASAPTTLALLWWDGTGLAALPSFPVWLQFYGNVVLVAALTTLLFTLLESRLGPKLALAPSDPPSVTLPQAAVAESAPPQPPFLQRLPAGMRDRLIALEMEDHYVRAHAPGESKLILLRMRDAVAEIAGIEGTQVHRSWWVRRDAIERVAGAGRNVRLVLTGGLEAPVARDRISELRAAGWLER